VLSIQDLYPDSLVVQARLAPDSVAVRLIQWLDRTIAASTAALIVPARRFIEVYRDSRGIPEDRIHFVPNWIEPSLIQCAISKDECRRHFGIPEPVRLYVYSGNIGAAAGLDRVVEVFIGRCHRQEAVLIAGAGSQLGECQRLCRRNGCTNVLIHTPYPRSDTAMVLAAADVFLLPTYGEQGLASLPSKMISYMLAGRPILAIACPDSELSKIIKSVDCGWVVDSTRPQELDRELDFIGSLPQAELLRRGENGRRFAQEHFAASACLTRLCSITRQVAQSSPQSASGIPSECKRDNSAALGGTGSPSSAR
jgi:glycosyltransferase involved in cell wall biosynthesis